MKLLFVHQNFPGQYRHLAAFCAAQPGNRVVALVETANVARNIRIPDVELLGYEIDNAGKPEGFEASILQATSRGKVVARAAVRLRQSGFVPDVVFAHIGWGEALFLKDIFPEARVLLYCEFFYRARGSDLGFDPEFPATAEKILRLRVMNAPLLMSLDASDCGMAPTQWQKRQFPAPYAAGIAVVHDGIDTQVACPSRDKDHGEGEELITYASRNLEPYRGFHVFMRAIPEIQRRRPKARIVIVGGDAVSYSPRLPHGQTYRERLLRELDGRIDLSRVTFTGRLPYSDYLALLRRSSVHVYLTYPFVLSWSLLEALACGCLVVGSRTPPVEEVIREGANGLLVDFFSTEKIAERIDFALSENRELNVLRENARATAVQRYDLQSVCLPAQRKLVGQLAGLSRPRRAA